MSPTTKLRNSNYLTIQKIPDASKDDQRGRYANLISRAGASHLVLVGVLQLTVGLPHGADTKRSIFPGKHKAKLRQPLKVRRGRAASLDHALHHIAAVMGK